tara:strand:- start:2982 stop:4490 length:1509 start_codon:yes stop_codon:yes gene_type:complete
MRLYFIFWAFLFSFDGYSEEVVYYSKYDRQFGVKTNSLGTFYSNSFKQYTSDFSFQTENLIDASLSLKIERFLGFWINDFKKNMVCTSQEYSQYRDYLRYVYRLLYISLLAETQEELSLYLLKLGGQKMDPLRGIAECKPQSVDMKKFISRASSFDFANRSRLVGELLPSEKKELMAKIKKGKETFINHYFCKIQDCKIKELLRNMNDLYVLINTEIRALCEETGSLQVMENKQLLLSLIYNSPALNIFESDKMKSACLNKINDKELKKDGRKSLVELMGMVLKFKQSGKFSGVVGNNALGNLFNFGALKYFDNLGLGDLIFEEVKVAKSNKPLEIKKIIKVIKKKKISKSVVKKIEKIELKTKKAEEKKYELSAIEEALLYFRVKGREAPVDMDKFSLDYPEIKKDFMKKQIALERFQTRKSLGLMKRVDKLGEKNRPFPLKFLKFLIDFDYHQGLYNVLAEIGGDFYVVNDIEKKKKSFKINLRNDEQTNYKWNIKVVGY